MQTGHLGRRSLGVALVTALLLLAVGAAPILGFFDAATSPPREARRYIVQLVDPPLAQYEGTIGKLAPTAAYVVGDVHLNTDSPAARAYLAYLDRQQRLARAHIQTIAPGARFDWSYRNVFNGFAATLTPEQARRVLHLDEVAGVTAEEKLEPEMDASVPLMNVDKAFEMVGGIEEAGLGARVAIIDSGTDSKHPMFRDEGMPPPPEEFPTATMHLRDGSVTPYPDAAEYVNNKLIAARIFVSPESMATLDDPTHAITTFLPVGTGHGLHVSGIAAGRYGTYTALQNGLQVPIEMSGIAPMAYVLNYKSNYAASPEYIAMLDQMVEDEVDALNLSQGHVVWLIDRPETHALSRAFQGAFDAGIVVVASAGNAGSNGLTSLSAAFKYTDKVIAVANATAGGSWDVKLSLSGEGRPADEIIAAPRGTFTYTEDIAGDLIYADDGCQEVPEAAGKIAVVYRRDENGNNVGSCSYGQRAVNMKASGAIAIVYYYASQYLGNASSTNLALPAIAVGTNGGTELIEWLQSSPPDAAAVISHEVKRARSDRPDMLSGSSSRGPGLDWQLKPDITAPGTGIMSSQWGTVDGQRAPIVRAMSGTSMASPQVAGAATLLRSAHPDWTSAQVRDTLICNSKRSVGVSTGKGSRDAAPYEAGPGRLDLEHAIDPGAFVSPSKASFGSITQGETASLTFQVTSASAKEEQFQLFVQPITGTSPSVDVRSLVLAPGESKAFTLTLDTAGSDQKQVWGDVLLQREGTEQSLRLAYYAVIEDPAEAKDVLLIDWLWGETPDHGSYYTETLEALDLTYDVWTIDDAPADEVNRRQHPPLATMKLYDLVILNLNESDWALQLPLTGQYQYLNYLLSGGNMLIAGQGEMNWWRFLSKRNYPDNNYYHNLCGEYWPKCMVGPSQNAGCDMCLPRYFSGFTFGVTATLTGRVLHHPEPPLTPTIEVVLPPHADADGAFPYAVDISTGDLAKDGAAGNQYTFASGSILGPYVPGGETAAEGRDYDSTEGVFDRVQPFARPLWSFTGEFENDEGENEVMTKTVGTYIAGKLVPDAHIAWNSMFWGFGLEGVGKGSEDTVSRQRLLGDAFNFLARNIRADEIAPQFTVTHGLTLAFPTYARVPLLEKVDVDWGDGSDLESFVFEQPMPADELALHHDYAQQTTYRVTLDLHPMAHAAPIFGATGEIEGARMLRFIHLPATLKAGQLGAGLERERSESAFWSPFR